MNWDLLSSELSAEALAALRAHVEKQTNDEEEDSSTGAQAKESGGEGEGKCWKEAKNFEYKEKWYWEERFAEEESFEWLLTYEQVERYLLPHLRYDDRILIIGCGNSSLSDDLYERGYQKITNIDFSETVISKMSLLSSQKGHSEMKWLVMDMLDMKFDDTTYDVVLDKATMDALMVDEGDVWYPNSECKIQAHRLCREVHRVLKDEGLFLQISFAQPHFRSKYLSGHWLGSDDEILDNQEQNTSDESSVAIATAAISGRCISYMWDLSWQVIVARIFFFFFFFFFFLNVCFYY